MHCATGIVTGDIYSGNSFRFAGSSLDLNGSADTVLTVDSNGSDISIDTENENIAAISMPDLDAVIEQKAAGYTAYDKSVTFKKSDIFADISMKTEGSFKFNNSTLTGQCYVIAKEDISLGINTANVQPADQLVIYSQNGDITINGPDFVMNGILYAPNGTVKITSSTFTLNGRIIADRIELNCNQITVNGAPEDLNLLNDAPVVDAGPDAEAYLSDRLPLNGAVRDDAFLLSLPETTWEAISGPGTVTFSDPKAAVTTASFSMPGTYELRLKAFDGLLESSDIVVVTVLDNAVYKTYTTQEDFQEGTLINAVTDETSLKIDGTANVLDFIWVANSSKGTVMKINTLTCEIVGEFKTSPSGQPSNPSRTTVDHDGSVWVANRDGSSVVKIGLAENGGWIDKNGNGKCDTSIGLGNILTWSNTGGADTLGGTATALDECILLYVKVPCSGTRHISVDKDDNIWVSGIGTRSFVLLDGETGAILRTEKSVGYGGYGGLIDENGVIWSANRLLRWDTSKPLSGANGVNWKGYSADSYGLAIDSEGNVWNTSLYEGKIRKYSPDGTLIGTFSQGNINAQGCAVDQNDNVWVAHSLYSSTIGRLKSDGTYLGTIKVETGPTGIAVDAQGFIWVACYYGYIQKIDPNKGPLSLDGVTPLGEIVFTSQKIVGLLYNYSDMTGSTLTGAPKAATWTAVYDSEDGDTQWGKINWKSKVYNDGSVEVLVSTSTDNITFSEQIIVNNGEDFDLPTGRYVRLEARLTRSKDGYSPVLDEITIASKQHALEMPVNQAPIIEVPQEVLACKNKPYKLCAFVTDDAFFSGIKLDFLWTCEDASVSFSDAKATNPNITFAQSGTYSLKLTVSDGALSSEASVSATVIEQDSDFPSIALTTDKESYSIGETLKVSITASDNVAVKEAYLLVNGTKKVLRADNSCEIVLTEAGVITLEAYAVDTSGNVSQTAKEIQVADPNAIPPELTAELSDGKAYIGETVSLSITASDDQGTVTVSVEAEGGSIQQTNGVYTYTASEVGSHPITVTATDGDGNQTTVILTIEVAEKPVVLIPDVSFSGITDGQVITAPTDISGTISEEGLNYYLLEYAPIGGTAFTEFARGTQAVDNGVLGTFDPTLLNNGWYTIRISGYGASGAPKTTEMIVSVEGQMKIGNFSIAFQDMTVAVDNFPLTIIREYDSRDRNTSGDFGYGWNLSMSGVKISESVTPGTYWNQKSTGSGIGIKYNIIEDKPHTVSIDWANGQIDKFDLKLTPSTQPLVPITYEISASYAAQAGNTSTLEAMGTTTGLIYNDGMLYDLDVKVYNPTKYKLTKADGTVYIIDEKTGVESITYTDGTVLTFDEDGVYHSDGKSILFERDTAGRITKITDPAGKEVTYTYDAAGNLTNVVDLSGATTSFEYDSSHYLTAIIDPRGVTVSRNEYDENGRLTATIDADGNRMEFTHDIAGRQEVIKDRLGNATIYVYDDRGNVLSETDANNNTTTYEYDANDQMTSKTDALGNTSLFSYDADAKLLSYTDAGGNVLTNTYNEKGYLTSMAALGVTQLVVSYDAVGSITDTTDAQGNTNTYSYDSENRVTGITDNIGEYVKFTYDAEGHAATATNGLGETSTFTYDTQGNCISRSQNSTTDAGAQVITEHYAYDAAGHLTQIIYADGTVTNTEYNNIGKISAAVDSKGRRTAYEYDLFGNLSKITYCDNTTETFAYDKEGRNTSATDRMGRTIQMTYDAVGNMLSITYPNTASISYTYDSVYRLLTATGTNGGVTDYEYDALGRNTAIADALGNRTTFGYGAASLLTSMTDAKGNTYSYEYDLNGNRTKTTLPDGSSIATAYDARGRVTSVTDQHNYTTSYTYDTVDRLTAVTDAAGQSWNYTYNETGALTTVSDANGSITSYQYDTMGRVTQTTNAGGATASMTYDEAGNILTSTNYAGVTTTYTYDGLDRLAAKTTGTAVISFTYTVDGLLDTVTDANGVTRYTYDTMNGLTDIQYPDGTYIHYVYDTAFRLTSIQTAYGTTGYAYDLMNRLTSVTDLTGAVTSYTYDANGNRSTMTYANGVTTNYAYDTCNRLTAETVTDSTGTILESYAITLGASGERTQIVELHRTVAYEYDSLYRLIKETISADGLSKETAYTYDAMGNRLTKTSDGIVTNYTYNALNQLLSENDITYTYDVSGSQVSQQSPAKTAAYTYDQEGRLITAVVTAGGTTTTEEYRYNWSGIRTAKITDGVETRYLIDPNGSLSQVIAELDSAGNLVTFYTRGAELISLHRTGETRYYQYDANGTVRLLTDGAGAITDTYTYDAFGNLLGKTGATVNNYLYTGEQFDANTGFYYLRARYMNPSTGTFISMDPAQGSIFDPVSLHKYLYANANPVMNCDPSGRSSGTKEDLMAAIGIQATIGAIVNGSIQASMRVFQYLISGGDLDAGNLIFEFFDGFMQGAIIGGAFGALFGAFGAIAAESILANFILRSVFTTMGLTSAADASKLFGDGDYWGGSLKIVEAILWGLGGKYNYYRGGITNSTYTITDADVAVGGSGFSGEGGKGNKNVFPSNPNDFLPDVPNTTTPRGNIKWEPNNNTRVQYHPGDEVKVGETYNPRHHNPHYHVEIRLDPIKGWNNPGNTVKLPPDGYTIGSGTGFLPGEKFPGL